MKVKNLKYRPDWFRLVLGGERYDTTLCCLTGTTPLLVGKTEAGKEVALEGEEEIHVCGFASAANRTPNPVAE